MCEIYFLILLLVDRTYVFWRDESFLKWYVLNCLTLRVINCYNLILLFEAFARKHTTEDINQKFKVCSSIMLTMYTAGLMMVLLYMASSLTATTYATTVGPNLTIVRLAMNLPFRSTPVSSRMFSGSGAYSGTYYASAAMLAAEDINK